MHSYISLIFVFFITCARANIIFNAKFMGNWRVSGDSIVLHALSVSHCLAICNKNATCDAITYHDKMSKCRLFKRCTPMRLTRQSSNHWFYAKRPPINRLGYQYENLSDTCLAVKNNTVNYEGIHDICAEDRAYPAVLSTPSLLFMANQLLREYGENEAWINPPYKTYEKFAKNRETQKKTKSSMVEKNGGCWVLHKGIPMKKSPCTMAINFTICQLPTY